jgi:hypothetical protein
LFAAVTLFMVGLAPVAPKPPGPVQLKVDPGSVLVADKFRVVPAHFGPSFDAVATGVGFTVTV